ncbi:MAG: hypothetical protein HS111_35745 [Kofleriaceae bacterium]|nr:hypothetical protein [Kofleriaceae bacterium]
MQAAGGAGAPPPGQERGGCRGDGGCDPGLVPPNLCVRPPPADCGAIARSCRPPPRQLRPHERRDAFIAATRARCEAMQLGRDDGACLLARSRADLAACPRPSARRLRARDRPPRGDAGATSGVDAHLVTEADRIVGRCRSEAPSLAFEQCVLAARSFDDVERCAW